MTNDSNSLEYDLPEQYKGDKLFKGDIDWWHNAVIDSWSVEKDSYATGYKMSGDLLVDHVIRDRASRFDLVFPIVFLYRQYLELRMKDIIIAGRELMSVNEKFPGHHKLDKLWCECRLFLESRVNSTDLHIVEKYIQEFSEKDPTSEAFRYPSDNKGKLSLPEIIINPRSFREVMGKIAAILDSAIVDIYHSLQEKRINEAQN